VEGVPTQRLPPPTPPCHGTFGMPDTIAKSHPPDRHMMRIRREVLQRPLAAALGALALVSLIFLLAPNLDLAVSRVFYASPTGFSSAESGALEALRDGGRIVEWAFAALVVAPLLIKILFPHRRLLLPPRATLFVLATFALGPWLIVNGILKAFWGRARPRAILEFGGDATFSPAWWISDQCGRNCSFVSGEAASAFCLVALVFLVRKEWRPAVAAATLAFAAAVSFTRVAAGGHFLSDVLIAWLMTLCVMIALHRMVLKGLPPAFDRAVETAAGRSGEALRRLFQGRPPV
jgi:lipid A 4'-phosphatase